MNTHVVPIYVVNFISIKGLLLKIHRMKLSVKIIYEKMCITNTKFKCQDQKQFFTETATA